MSLDKGVILAEFTEWDGLISKPLAKYFGKFLEKRQVVFAS